MSNFGMKLIREHSATLLNNHTKMARKPAEGRASSLKHIWTGKPVGR